MTTYDVPTSLSPSRVESFTSCLARDSLVLTKGAGYKAIQEIVPGELVLTHRGRWRPVLVVERTNLCAPVVTIRATGVPGLTLTPGHKVWSRLPRNPGCNEDRRQAADAVPDWNAASDLIRGYVNRKLPPVETSTLDAQRWWIVGRWLGDGMTTKNPGHGRWGPYAEFHLTCGHHETAELVQRLGEHAGYVRSGRTGAKIYLRDRGSGLIPTLKACGEGAAGKHLPPEGFTLDQASARALLDGYLSADGHLVDAGRRKPRWVATSVSRQLLLGMAFVAHRGFGAVASVYAGRPARIGQIEGRTVNMRAEWVLTFGIPESAGRNGKPFILDDGAWMKVRRVEATGEAETWNLRVAEDESYTAEGCVVKNCPLAFRFVNIEKIDDPPTIHTTRGSLVHRALELAFLRPAADRTAGLFDATTEQAIVEYREHPDFTRLGLSEAETATFEQQCRQLVANYLRMEDPTTVQAIGLELMLSTQIGGLTLRGIIDRLELRDGELVVTDYKTGRAPSVNWEQRSLSGVHFYSLLCQEVFGRLPAAIRLMYLSSGETIETKPSERSARFVATRTAAVFQAVERACATGDFKPHQSALCNSCRFQPWCPSFGGNPELAAVEAPVAFGLTSA